MDHRGGDHVCKADIPSNEDLSGFPDSLQDDPIRCAVKHIPNPGCLMVGTCREIGNGTWEILVDQKLHLRDLEPDLRQASGVGQCCTDILSGQERILGNEIVGFCPSGDGLDHHVHGQAGTANARLPKHQFRIHHDSIDRFHRPIISSGIPRSSPGNVDSGHRSGGIAGQRTTGSPAEPEMSMLLPPRASPCPCPYPIPWVAGTPSDSNLRQGQRQVQRQQTAAHPRCRGRQRGSNTSRVALRQW
jgi:hypothetical protein